MAKGSVQRLGDGDDGRPDTPVHGTDALAWAPPLVAGRYLVSGFLRHSGLGRTYQGQDPDTGTAVEVTFLDDDALEDPTAAAATLEQLSGLRHLHVLPLLGWGLDPAPYLVYPQPEMRLSDLGRAGAVLSPSQVLLVGLQAAETLHGLRGLGITHGALEPSHCCIDERGRLRLAEMGVDFLRRPLRPAEETRPAPGTLRRYGDDTPAGSQVGKPLDHQAAADVHSLALVLAEAATGRPVAAGRIGEIGRTILPPGAGAATARSLTRLAPLLVQAAVERPESRLEADELALALRATAEMFPPPMRLEEAFQQVAEHEAASAPTEPVEPVDMARSESGGDRLVRLVASAAVAAAALLGVVLSAPGDDIPAHTVPDVVGLGWPEAQGALAESGWQTRRLEVRVAGLEPEQVVAQLPGPGELLDEGQVVKVQVTLGDPLVVIPADIVGLGVAEAGLRLSAIGLRLGDVRTQADPSVPAGTVLAVAEALPELPRGRAVNLVVAGGG